MSRGTDLGWGGVVRLGLVQAALGGIVVMTTSTLNRVMVVELALPALLPGLLVALHYLVQLVRPRMGFGADTGGRSTPWIVGGMAVLALGGVLAAWATTLMPRHAASGTTLAIVAFSMIGVGVSACGTALLVLLAKRVDAAHSARAATVVWLMMIVGFAVTAGVAGHFLDPYSPARLLAVTGVVSVIALSLTLLAMFRLEGPADAATKPREAVPVTVAAHTGFRAALREVWADRAARRFTVFVFVAMLAYSTQDLILEPFAGAVLGFTPGESTRLSGLQHGGALAGMLLAAIAGSRFAGRSLGSLQGWTTGGCLFSALALLGLAAVGWFDAAAPFKALVFMLGVANGAFSIAAIASMMRLAAAAGTGRAGVRMGLWGAAQAIAFGLGGLLGTAGSDLARWWLSSSGQAYAMVFAVEAGLFVISAMLATAAMRTHPGQSHAAASPDRAGSEAAAAQPAPAFATAPMGPAR